MSMWRMFVPAVLTLAAAGAWSLHLPATPVVVQATIAPAPAADARMGAGDLAAAPARIDELVRGGWSAAGIKGNPLIGDAAFVRRAYLVIIGRNPTWQESAGFIASTDHDKRRILVRALVAHPGRVHHRYTFFADLLRVQSRLQDRYPGQPYIAWIKQSISERKPFDAMVRELITADGKGLERGNGATGFWMRDAGMPLDHMATTVQAFLGTQVGCAQCHDHPFDSWKRMDFYQMAAFTSGVRTDRSLPGGKDAQRELRKRYDLDKQPEIRDALRRLSETVGARVISAPKSSIQLPADWQYPAVAKPGDTVQAHAILGGPPVAKGENPRQVLAAWMTADSNPRFAVVIANRMWREVFGLGLVEPVDAFTDQTRASNPELLAYLGQVMQGVGYDLDAFIRILCETELFQRATTTMVRAEIADPGAYAFPGPILRRLTAEQTWDSLKALLVAAVDGAKGDDAEAMWTAYDLNKDKDPEQLYQLAKDMADAKAKSGLLRKEYERLRATEKTATPEQAKAIKQQLNELRKAREALENDGKHLAALGRGQQNKGGKGHLRAAELSSPAQPGHLLRIFGQSDRETPLASSDAAAVTQALALMNSLVDKEILAPKSVLAKAIAGQRDLAEQARVLFLAVLGRPPRPDELQMTGTAMAAAGATPETNTEVLKDLAWVLINSHEFRFLP